MAVSTILNARARTQHLPLSRIPSRLWGPLLLTGYFLFAIKLEHRHLHHPGHALAFCGVVMATALMRAGRSSRFERVAWALLVVFLLGAEVREARAYRLSERTFLYCDLQRDGKAQITRVGASELRDVTMRVVDFNDLHALHVRRSDDLSDFQAVFQTVQLGNFLSEGQKDTILLPPKAHGDLIRYRIRFTASNGNWWEDVEMRKRGDLWLQALRVRRFQGSTPHTLFELAEPGFNELKGSNWKWASEL